MNRNLQNFNSETFVSNIRKSDFVSSSSDLDTVLDRFNSNLRIAFDELAPVSSKDILIRPNSQWYNANLRQQKVIRRRLERKAKKSGKDEDRIAYRKQCIFVNSLCNELKTEFFSSKIVECGRDQKRLFRVAKSLLGWKNAVDLPSNISESSMPSVFNDFFINKILKIRNDIGYESLNNLFSEIQQNVHSDLSMHDGPELDCFELVTSDELKKIINNCSSSSCELDPIPTWLLKECLSDVLPSLTKIVNLSLQNGIVPIELKKAIVRPLLKKATLDPDSLKNYRPISNLSFVSKLVERVVASRLNTYLSDHSLYDKFQSAYRSFHSTETALLRVQNDILTSLDNQNAVALVMLDLSAAFDTIDHNILFHRLEFNFGIKGNALSWLKSYLSDRVQSVSISNVYSDNTKLTCGVPQGSVLGPLLFSLYVSPLSDVANRHNMLHHFYADDSQLYVSFDPKSSFSFQAIESCIADFKSWMQANMLKLNDGKTEFIIFSSRFYSPLTDSLSITVGSTDIDSVSSVRNLGAQFDSSMSMEKFVNDKIKSCLFYLSCIARIRKFLTEDATKFLVHAYVISRLDYAKSLWFGVNKYLT